jgi:hypothetical protein
MTLTVPIILLVAGLAMFIAGLVGKTIPITATFTIPQIENKIVRIVAAIMGLFFIMVSLYLFNPELVKQIDSGKSGTQPPPSTPTVTAVISPTETLGSPSPSKLLPFRMTFIANNTGAIRPLISYLEEQGAEVSLITTQELNKLAATRPDMIIVGADTGDFWNTQSQPIMAQLFENYKVIGLGDGGARLFDQLNLEIGWGNGAISTSPTVTVEIPELVRTPFVISATDNVIDVYRSGSYDVIGIYDEGSSIVAGFEGIARWKDSHHWPITRQGNYVLWAFDAPTEQMTIQGKQLFVNLLLSHKVHPAVPLSQARKKVSYIETGRISDRLTEQFSHRKWIFQVQHVGQIKATLTWNAPDHSLALILNGPGQIGYFAREDGVSPLNIEFTVTEEHLLKGTDWSITVESFENLADAAIDFNLQLSLP